ncbi:hypothetical protein [Nocardia amikacinitolerans]|uniref:hypothetical protein n=1 Tax=Nocardia amikacinitolerans TaxID=756689 RepID=UPI0020A557E2|nr:hypothetical protein [Nocardia amikacinitolerans]MCP2274636.1 hypothetical protein [Nocardia amikacinitolerans]
MGAYLSTSDLPLPADWERKAFGSYRYAVLPFAMGLVFLQAALGVIWAVLVGEGSAWEGILVILLPGALGTVFLLAAWSQVPRKAPVAAEIRTTADGGALVLPVRRNSILAGNRSTAGIELTPGHVTIKYGKSPIGIAWDDISTIESRCDKVRSTRTNVIDIVPRGPETGSRIIDLPHTFLATDPTRVYHLLRFYVCNPELRWELGNQAGLDRFQRGGYGSEMRSGSQSGK